MTTNHLVRTPPLGEFRYGNQRKNGSAELCIFNALVYQRPSPWRVVAGHGLDETEGFRGLAVAGDGAQLPG